MRRKMRSHLGALLVALGLAFVLGACHGGAHPTFVVDSGLDAPDDTPGNGTCDATVTIPGAPPDQGTQIVCTLRAAIDEANTLTGDDTATIELTTDVTLSIPGTDEDLNATGDLDINHGLTINGQGHTIDADGIDRVLDHHTGHLTILDTTITGGDLPVPATSGEGGGGIQTDGASLLLTGVTLTQNEANSGSGGLYVTDGELDVYDSSIVLSTLSNCSGFCGGAAVTTNDAIRANFTRVTITDNVGIGSPGGLFFWFTDATLDTVAIRDNDESPDGHISGGSPLQSYSGSLVVQNSELRGNTQSSPNMDHVIEAYGTIRIENSTVAGNHNRTGGSLRLSGDPVDAVEILSSTIGSNNASNPTSNAYTILMEGNTTFTIRASTISAPPLGNALNHWGPSQVNLHGSAISGGAGSACWLDVGSVITSLGYNVVSDSTCNIAATGDLENTHPLLGPLQDNGGPTHTMLPLPGSPLLDAIPWLTAGLCDGTTPTDQRGLPRPATPATACDIGAVDQ